MMACYRLLHTGVWGRRDIVVGHSEILNKMYSVIPAACLPSDLMSVVFKFDKDFQVEIPSRSDWVEGSVVPSDYKVVFTDGSRLEGRSGAGVFMDHQTEAHNMSIPMGIWATVTQAELMAILAAAEAQVVKECKQEGVAICSDSQAALLALQSVKVNSKLVHKCDIALEELARAKRVRLIWVPGHTGVSGNESADSLAKAAAQMEWLGPEPAVGLSNRTFKTGVHAWLYSVHQKYWDGLDACRQAKVLLGGLNSYKSKKVLRCSRQKLRILTAVLTGHCALNKHLFVMGRVTDPLCPLCQEEDETSFHLLAECPALYNLRIQILGVNSLSAADLSMLGLVDLLALIKGSGRFQL